MMKNHRSGGARRYQDGAFRRQCMVAGSLIAACLVAGCAAPSRRPAVPLELEDRVMVLEKPGLRTWSDEVSAAFLAELRPSIRANVARFEAQGKPGPIPTHILAISGGGSNGAYGAGLLCGWTAAGTRPEFDIVTGVSTGALIAPFAFLGADHDETLRYFYTEISTPDILKRRPLLAGLFHDALADNSPLQRILDEQVDEELLREIATAYRNGRLLLISTTNLDAQRGVVWNMGAIAAEGTPEAQRLFEQILLASAAIPAAFPPVMIDVAIDGEAFQEMHVDGGAIAQVFVYPPSFVPDPAAPERDRRLYVIRNGRVDPQWSDVKRQTLSIAGRAISCLLETQGMGNLYEIYLLALRDGMDYNLAYIPETFDIQSREPFDPVYMNGLFGLGFDAARDGYPWVKLPPGYVDPNAPVRADDAVSTAAPVTSQLGRNVK